MDPCWKYKIKCRNNIEILVLGPQILSLYFQVNRRGWLPLDATISLVRLLLLYREALIVEMGMTRALHKDSDYLTVWLLFGLTLLLLATPSSRRRMID